MPYIKENANGYYEYSTGIVVPMSGWEYVLDDDPRIEKAMNKTPYTLNAYKDKVRQERNSKLSESDKYKLSDFPKGAVTDAQINTYRQELRDLIGSITEIDQVITWPTDPLA